MARPSLRSAVFILAFLMLVSVTTWWITGRARRRAVPAVAVFVGRTACRDCHQDQDRLWRGSHHDLAMQPANDRTVLGDFSGRSLTQFGVTSTFYRRDGAYFVRSDGPEGVIREYRIDYTFGVTPLQQYLIPFPGGRLQAFSLAWDSRAKSDGGQRWFHLYPQEPVPASDVLHWTRPSQNWNYMCAECHSTDLRKRFHAESDSYETTFSEINVACEACHGPGSTHVAWAKERSAGRAWPDASKGLPVRLQDPVPARWVFDEGASIARRDRPRDTRTEIETCARCHARRSVISEDYVYDRPLLDTHRPSLLEEGLYHPDGQILDEVYEYASFLQSRMAAAGVTCSDCHDPHRLRFEGRSDAVCGRCHLPARYFRAEHHRHPSGKPGTRCVECHMIERTYMVVDARRDHSFRVPRPDISERIGTPNACNDCHQDRTAGWSSAWIARWYGPTSASRRPHYGEVLAAGRTGLLDAERALGQLIRDLKQPGIVRATALELLARGLGPTSWTTVELAVSDVDPLVRSAAATALEAIDPVHRARLAARLLSDPVRGVRIEAGRILAGSAERLDSAERSALGRALEEYRVSQRINADRPEAHFNLGNLAERLGQPDVAAGEFEIALKLSPSFAPAYVNLADVHHQQGRDEDAESILERGLAVMGETVGTAELHHALGLTLVRLKRPRDAIVHLERAAVARPDQPRFAYALGLALDAVGQRNRALSALEKANQRHPGDRDLLMALVTLTRDAGDRARALSYARRLTELHPDDREARQLAAELELRR